MRGGGAKRGPGGEDNVLTDCLITHNRLTIRFPIKWNTDDVFDQAAYYARRQGEFRDVMSKLEEMARLGAKVGNAQ